MGTDDQALGQRQATGATEGQKCRDFGLGNVHGYGIVHVNVNNAIA
jgi:hypothetical protein